MSADHGAAQGLDCSSAPCNDLQAGRAAPTESTASAAILFRIVVNGRGMYYGFFQHACDAIRDALEHGASSVAVARV